MENTEQGTQTVNSGDNTEVQENVQNSVEVAPVQQKEKTFTQEEVNAFIQSRIGRMKEQAAKETQAEYNQKLQELHDREIKILVKEKLSERGMPRELADVITCTDEKDLTNKLDAIQAIYDKKTDKKETPAGFIRIGAEQNNETGGTDPVRKAMGLDRKD